MERRAVSGDESGEDNEGRRAESHQRIGTQARQTIAPLPFEADDCAEAQGNREIDGSLFDRNCHAQFPSRTMAFCGGTGGTQGFCRAR
jgi:hypothetical protein